jgi:hypothetical protein
MAKELKIGLAVLLSILGILAVVSVIGSFAQRNFAIKGVTQDKAEVEASAKAIADYTLPSGYEPAMAMTMDAVKIASFHDKANTGAILFLQVPQAATPDDIEQAVNRALARQELNGTVKWSPSTQATMTIAGKPVMMKAADGKDDNGNAMKSLRGVYEGKNGRVALFIIGSASSWTQSNVDAFLGSLN